MICLHITSRSHNFRDIWALSCTPIILIKLNYKVKIYEIWQVKLNAFPTCNPSISLYAMAARKGVKSMIALISWRI